MEDLPGCSVPPEQRIPPPWLKDSLVAIADLDASPVRRASSIEACAISGGASGSAAAWLLGAMESMHPVPVMPGGVRVQPQVSAGTRSDYIVGLCHVVGLKTLPIALRHKAAYDL
jgi:hypothetical protein